VAKRASRRKRLPRRTKKLPRRKLLGVLIFLVKFNLLALPMYAVMYSGISLPWLQQAIADFLYATLKAAGYTVAKQGIVLTLVAGNAITNIIIDMDCTGWKSMYAVAALALATPAPNDWKKLKFIAAGASALFALNLLRVFTTIVVAYEVGFGYLDIVHTLLWREGLIIAVLAIWYLWLRNLRLAKHKK